MSEAKEMTAEEREEAELEAEAARLDAKKEAAERAARLELLRARKAGESLGVEGRDWAVVATGEGVVLVKRVAILMQKRWRSQCLGAEPITAQQAFDYVSGGVVLPDAATFKAWHNGNEFVATTVANALTALYAASEGVTKKGR